MIIREIGMISFGKFQEQILTLQDGLTVVYGENESGKTTLHRLIEGVLFGFYKPYLKNKRFDEEQEKYRPRGNDNQYKAYMIYQHQGSNYRYERNFKAESIQVLNLDTGEDVTATFEYDDVIKQYTPANSQFGLNRMSYRNTVAIEQMKVLTDNELVKEVIDKLLSISDTNTESISIDAILKNIDELRNDIGSTRKKTSDYYKVSERLYQLREEKDQAVLLEEKALAVQGSYVSLKEDYEKAIHDLTVLRMKKEKLEATSNLNILIHYESIMGQIDEKEKRYQERGAFKDIQIEQLDELMVLKQEYQILVQQLEPLEGNIGEEEEALSKLLEMGTFEDDGEESPEAMDTNYRLVKRLQEDIRGLELVINKEISDRETNPGVIEAKIKQIEEMDTSISNEENDLNHIDLAGKEKELKKAKGTRNLMNMLSLVMALGMAGSAFLFMLNEWIRYGIVAGLFLLLLIFLVIGRRSGKKVKEVQSRYDFSLKKQGELEKDIAHKKSQKDAILKSYNTTSLSDMRMIYVKALSKENSAIDYQQRRNNLIQEREELLVSLKKMAFKYMGDETVTPEIISEIKRKYKSFLESKGLIEEKRSKLLQNKAQLETLQTKLEVLDNRIQIIKTENDLQEDDIKALKEQKQLYDSEFKEVEALKDSLEKLLYQKNLEDIKNAREILANTKQVYVEMEDKEFILSRFDDTQERINVLSKQLGQLESDVTKAETAYRSIQEIEEEMARNEEKLQEYDFKLRKYDLMTRALLEAREDVQKNFAPEINRRISQMISVITEGKYNDLMVTQDMKMIVVDRKNHEAINVETLSSGTLDQIYFALRMAISDIMDDKGHLPLLLDESFSQFDDARFGKAVTLLNNMERQVLYFTCKQSEVDHISRVVPEANIIKL